MKIIFRLLIMEIKTRKYFTLKIIAKTTKYVVSRFSRIVDHPSSKVGSWASNFSKLFGLSPDGPKGLIANVVRLATFRFRKKQLHSHSHSRMLSNEEFIYCKLCYVILKKGGHLRKHQAFAIDGVHLMLCLSEPLALF